MDLKACTDAIITEMDELAENGVNIDSQHIDIYWILCCDWKFLAEFLRLNAANSSYFCIWCFCDKADIGCLEHPYNYWKIEHLQSVVYIANEVYIVGKVQETSPC